MLKQGGKEVREHNQFIEFPNMFVVCFEKKFTAHSQGFDWWTFSVPVSGLCYIQRQVHLGLSALAMGHHSPHAGRLPPSEELRANWITLWKKLLYELFKNCFLLKCSTQVNDSLHLLCMPQVSESSLNSSTCLILSFRPPDVSLEASLQFGDSFFQHQGKPGHLPV